MSVLWELKWKTCLLEVSPIPLHKKNPAFWKVARIMLPLSQKHCHWVSGSLPHPWMISFLRDKKCFLFAKCGLSLMSHCSTRLCRPESLECTGCFALSKRCKTVGQIHMLPSELYWISRNNPSQFYGYLIPREKQKLVWSRETQRKGWEERVTRWQNHKCLHQWHIFNPKPNVAYNLCVLQNILPKSVQNWSVFVWKEYYKNFQMKRFGYLKNISLPNQDLDRSEGILLAILKPVIQTL